jgi:hypothetical protein
MADITIGNTTIKNPLNYVHGPGKLENYERTLNGTMIINRSVNSEDQPISKYHFEIPGLIDSEMFLIKEEAVKIGNLYLIDYHKIIEVLSGDGTTVSFTLQRLLSGATPLPVVEVNDAGITVTVNALTNPLAGNVYINKDTGVMTFGTAPTNVDDNIVVKYEPKYTVHVISYQHVFYFSTIANYTLICEEV